MTRRWFYGPVQDPKYDVTHAPSTAHAKAWKKAIGSNLSDYSNWMHTRKDSVGKHLNLLFDAKKSQPSMEEKNATRIRKRNVDIPPSKDQKKGVEQQSVKLGFRHPKKEVLAEEPKKKSPTRSTRRNQNIRREEVRDPRSAESHCMAECRLYVFRGWLRQRL